MAKPDVLGAIRTIDACKVSWEGLVPDEELEWLVDRIKSAVEIYYELPTQAEFSDQLKKIESATTHPYSELVRLISNASEAVRKILEIHGGKLEIPSRDGDELADFAAEVRSRIIIASYWRPEGDKNRRMTRVVATPPFKRPKNARLELLVSLVSAAYAGATGNSVSRSWTLEEPKEIEILLDDVFDAIGISDNHSYLEALRRQVKNRS